VVILSLLDVEQGYICFYCLRAFFPWEGAFIYNIVNGKTIVSEFA
jgi:hypothetical protein